MSTYSVYLESTVSTVVEVECDSLDDLDDVLWEEVPGSLCHQCARTHETSGEWEVVTVYDGDEDVTDQTVFASLAGSPEEEARP